MIHCAILKSGHKWILESVLIIANDAFGVLHKTNSFHNCESRLAQYNRKMFHAPSYSTPRKGMGMGMPSQLQSVERMNHSIIGSFTTGDQKYASFWCSVTKRSYFFQTTFYGVLLLRTKPKIKKKKKFKVVSPHWSADLHTRHSICPHNFISLGIKLQGNAFFKSPTFSHKSSFPILVILQSTNIRIIIIICKKATHPIRSVF